MAAGPAIIISNPGMIVGPAVPQTDLAVAPNFERFDGLAARNDPRNPGPAISPGELDHPAGLNDGDYAAGFSTGGYFGESPRPGQMAQPIGQVYTEGPIQGVVGTVGGQPLIVSPRVYKQEGAYTPSKWPTIQHRLGVGQKGPSSLGVANTVALSEITNAPPVPGDLTSILAGLG